MTTHYKLLFSLLILVLLSSTLSGQSKASISGIVKDDATGDELIGAAVFVKEINQGTYTEIDGSYRIKSIPAGAYTLEITYLGYNTVEMTISLTAGQSLEQDINLSSESVTAAQVTVTAQAEGQIASINQQLASLTIKNVVSAKKIQETPNANAAEAIGRIPGVSIVRNGGEGSKIVIRGLAPKYNKVQVEGISMASTGGDNRSADLSMISPYMLDGIEVSKAAMPDQEADAIGGVVNFILRQAPEEAALDALLQGGYSNINGSFNNYKFVLGGSRRFFDKKLGVFGQIDLERRERSSLEFAANYFNPTPNVLDSFPTALGSMAVRDIKRDIKRTGATVVLDYKLPSGSLKLINFLSLINTNTENKYEQYNPRLNTHTYGLNQSEDDVRVMTNALKYNNSFGALTIDAGASFSQSVNERPLNTDFFATESNALEAQGITTNIPDSIQFYARNNVNNANIQRISKSLFNTSEDVYGANLDLSYDFTLPSSLSIQLKGGVKYRQLNKVFSQESYTIPVAQAGHGREFVTASLQQLNFLSDSLAPDVTKLPFSLFRNNDYGVNEIPGTGFSIQNVPDIDKVGQFADLAEDFYFLDHILSTKDNYSGEEENKAAYLMSIINIGNKITFIPGFRYVHNTTTYTGVRGDNTFQDWDVGYFHHDTTITRSNSFLLPMIHLRYKPADWFDVRVAYTKTLSRPDFNQIVPKWDIGISTVSFNNPFLEPQLSENIDVHFSAYKSKLGLLTLGGFYKKIDKLIYNAGLGAVTEDDIANHQLDVNVGTAFSRVVNNSNAGQLYGIELEWQTRFWYMDNFLKGLVLTANYTRTFSSVDYDRTVLENTVIFEPPWVVVNEVVSPYNERLLLQPTDIVNVTLGYDYKKTTARISFVYQNDIFSNPNFYRPLRGATDDYFRIDFSLTQKLPWEGFQLILNYSNLTSENEQDLLFSNRSPIRIQHYGSTLDVGLRYRLR